MSGKVFLDTNVLIYAAAAAGGASAKISPAREIVGER